MAGLLRNFGANNDESNHWELAHQSISVLRSETAEDKYPIDCKYLKSSLSYAAGVFMHQINERNRFAFLSRFLR
jgi:hypothetical protein